MTDLDVKLEKLQNQIIPLQTHALYLEFEEKLKGHLEQFIWNILIKKDKKLQRDRRAFEDGKSYKWQSNQNNNPSKMPNKNRRINIYEPPVHSSISSSLHFSTQHKGRRQKKSLSWRWVTWRIFPFAGFTPTVTVMAVIPVTILIVTHQTHTLQSVTLDHLWTSHPLHYFTFTTATFRYFFRSNEGSNTDPSKKIPSTPAQDTQIQHTQTTLNVVILSSHSLDQNEMAVLACGLTFCPDSGLDKFEVIKDIHLFKTHKLWIIWYRYWKKVSPKM